MKKILILGWIMVFLLSCEEDKNNLSPAERPDARLNAVLAEYKELLAGAEWGWKATLFPKGGSRYNFLFSFSENDRVRMLSDINAATASEEYESTYRLKAMQRPTLIFDTYSYLHILADPDERKSGGERGQGRSSDFEFYIEQITDDQIVLVGSYHGSRMVLERANQEEAAHYIQDIGETVAVFEKLNELTTYFKRLNLGGKVFDVSANTEQRAISFFYYERNVQRSFTSEFYYTDGSIVLLTPFSDGDLTISTLEDLSYNSINNSINLKINGSTATIKEAVEPVQTNALAASNFYDNPPNGSYGFSITGFTIENEVNAFDLYAIPDFYFLIFWPEFGELEGEVKDLLGFIVLNQAAQSLEIAYGPALQTTLLEDGRISFARDGSFDMEISEMPENVTATLEQLGISEGYYVIQTEQGFDLVSAKDAKAWISFF